jgi:nitrate reductase alpha subunit
MAAGARQRRLRRTDWATALEIISASMVQTIKKHGPDRIAGFSPIPAMSMISYAAGARLMQLIGGISLSFYDWYCDLPPASPETWGEQTDVAESADWYHAKMLVSMGANIGMTRTPDCHFLAEGRHNGTKLWVFSPDFNMVAKYADEWVAVNAGQDGAWWMAVNHVLLTEFHHQKKTDYFLDYGRKYTDSPYLVEITRDENGKAHAGQLVRAGRLAKYADEEHGEWKFLMWDEEVKGSEDADGQFRISLGHGKRQVESAVAGWSRWQRDQAAVDVPGRQ